MMKQSSEDNSKKDESVEDLLKKLAKKGKKVKLLDDATASVKELPKQEDGEHSDEEDPFGRNANDASMDEIMEDAAPSTVKKKIKKIK